MKTLVEIIEASEPDTVNNFSGYVDIEDFTRMKYVAIELAKACEKISFPHDAPIMVFAEANRFYISVARDGIARAKDIIGGGE